MSSLLTRQLPVPRLPTSPRSIALWWVLTRLLMLAAPLAGMVGHNVWSQFVGDVNLYGRHHDALWSGHLPYRDFTYEYPPGTLAFLLLPGPLRLGPVAFLAVWAAQMLALDAAVTAGLNRLARRYERPAAVWLWLAGGVLLAGLGLVRNDLMAVAPLVWAFVFLDEKRPALAGAALAFGAATKLWPALVLPLMLSARPGERRRLLLGAGVVTAAVLAPLAATGTLLPMLKGLAGFHGSGRGLEIEAVAATPVFLWHLVHGGAPRTTVTASIDIAGGYAHTASAATALATGAVLVALFAWTWITWRPVYEEGPRAASTGHLALTTSALLALLLVTSKVLSPQYLLWLLAAVALAAVTGLTSRRVSATLAAACALTIVNYPLFWPALASADTPAAAVPLIVRNVLLCVLAVMLVTELRDAFNTNASRRSREA